MDEGRNIWSRIWRIERILVPARLHPYYLRNHTTYQVRDGSGRDKPSLARLAVPLLVQVLPSATATHTHTYMQWRA